ncbi:uncharacterized protein HD556DRAFT_1305490 [Suillus plorans]|uniref:Uncharacterized protein n=1 Tax=Suillus plorans TaxID=116603 RepID=A0A9P7DNJ2_9AGAM|nr:uncharacterized protein HD556DRAFT_1305490 [Suillus plorans]KAG1799244.1 hypothetical protein HD556DRAFT_1305490 [Suillus plorans]
MHREIAQYKPSTSSSATVCQVTAACKDPKELETLELPFIPLPFVAKAMFSATLLVLTTLCACHPFELNLGDLQCMAPGASCLVILVTDIQVVTLNSHRHFKVKCLFLLEIRKTFL